MGDSWNSVSHSAWDLITLAIELTMAEYKEREDAEIKSTVVSVPKVKQGSSESGGRPCGAMQALQLPGMLCNSECV